MSRGKRGKGDRGRVERGDEGGRQEVIENK